MPDQDDNKIIVVGLPPGLKSDDLSKLCAPSGKVLNANVVVDASGAERGFGFVRFASAPEMQAAIAALDKTDLRGRTLNVRAVEKRDAPGGSRSAASKKRRPCFDFARGQCAKGANCPWAHLSSSADADGGKQSRRPEWQQTRGGGGAGGGARAVLADIPDDYCRRYQLGTCHRGGACRWKHEIWRGAEAAAKAEAATAEAGEDSPAVCPPAPRAPPPPKFAPPPVAANAPAWPARDEEPTVTPAELRRRLQRREDEWREAHPDHPPDEAVPAEAKNRDVIWRALERMLKRQS